MSVYWKSVAQGVACTAVAAAGVASAAWWWIWRGVPRLTPPDPRTSYADEVEATITRLREETQHGRR